MDTGNTSDITNTLLTFKPSDSVKYSAAAALIALLLKKKTLAVYASINKIVNECTVLALLSIKVFFDRQS